MQVFRVFFRKNYSILCSKCYDGKGLSISFTLQSNNKFTATRLKIKMAANRSRRPYARAGSKILPVIYFLSVFGKWCQPFYLLFLQGKLLPAIFQGHVK